ncbi:MAG: hypothetical protein ATN36_00485 [Epulopiscium sp. Nele67-Bin005]|nr:MAG: hypothetical protein ATN36_00485 [Epulopiscium sp. Nele67-Bin005]
MTSTNQDFTINKLIALYLLSELKMPLSLSQITEIVLEKGYADYFSMQQYLTELVEAKLIIQNRENHASYYSISDAGKQTLDFFASHIPSYVRTEIDNFISENWRSLRSELDVLANYSLHNEHEYIVECKILEHNRTLISLNLNVASQKQAIAMCEKWKSTSADLYNDILQLFC